MIKKELLKMPKLRATPYMLRRAKADKPKDVRVNKYTNWSYLRCCTKKGILKVSFFMTEAMRYGGTKPIYDIYFDRKIKSISLTVTRKKSGLPPRSATSIGPIVGLTVMPYMSRANQIKY